jgi:ABC-2 type transport system permease protein
MSVSLRRIWSLGRAEMMLFWRNRTAVFTALLLPVATVGFYASVSPAEGLMSTNAFMLTGVLGFLLLFVVYYNLVSAYVARREELVLKRLRAGESRDGEILAATAVPAVVVTIGQSVIAVAVGALLLDLPVPVNALVLLVGVLGGIVVFTLLAAASTAFTRNVEFAQISTMPVLLVCMVGSGALVPLEVLPDQVAQVARFVPLTPVVELIRLGWLGSPDGTFGQSVVPLAILVAWIVLGTYALRRWFRWEPRR